jgi:hypothetical protein
MLAWISAFAQNVRREIPANCCVTQPAFTTNPTIPSKSPRTGRPEQRGSREPMWEFGRILRSRKSIIDPHSISPAFAHRVAFSTSRRTPTIQEQPLVSGFRGCLSHSSKQDKCSPCDRAPHQCSITTLPVNLRRIAAAKELPAERSDHRSSGPGGR